MDTAERLLKLLALLQGRVDWTSDQLSDRLRVTPRTIRRDIARLRSLGYPVEALAGPGGGYRLGAGGKLPPLLLDDDEALAVAVGLRIAATSAVAGIEDSSLSAMAKLEQVLPPKLRDRLNDIAESTVTVPFGNVMIDPAELAVVSGAARSRIRLRFGYVDSAGRQTERHVEPLQVVHLGRRWYLAGYDLDRDDWRSFRMDRLSGARATGIRSTRRPAPDPVEMVTTGVAVNAYSIRAVIMLDAPIEIVRRSIPPSVGSLEGAGPVRTRLLIGADDLGWLARYLVSLPFSFEVEDPSDLRGVLADLGRALVTGYGKSAESE